MTDILYNVMADYHLDELQVAVVANGVHKQPFYDIIDFHDLWGRVAVCDFSEEMSRLGYASSDFILMPSLFEPCGLPQMIGCIYGSLPIVNDTGGLHDTIDHIDIQAGTGNGFKFNVYNSEGLRWAIDRAMDFYRLDRDTRASHVGRIMKEGSERFRHSVTAREYIQLYERMLKRPLVKNY